MAKNVIKKVSITAYAPYDNVNGIQCDSSPNLTATGTTPRRGTIAVDPRVIPYGATIIVVYKDGSVETGRAEDCGGAVKGNHIDVYRDTYNTAIKFGRKEATVIWYK